MRAMKILAPIAASSALLAGCATIEETVTEQLAETYTAYLVGAEVPGGGDPDGYARAEVTISDNFDRICWEIDEVRGVVPTSAHIHMGARGTNGPVVMALEGEDGSWTACRDGGEWRENRIEGNPSMFYVQIHTAEYPNGAIRGQLYDRD
ncbi:CHRD domain-containing protein [Sphingomicrobium marinum]|uniref:CHRD domain-containing protein n=1 Tax=Sphingomicrobium marinum TaxID=1227950 RepID=UPI00223FFCBE|nr:CHRD domain-containing protein [Sphingomicrobium marinum]